jgi:phage gpG-like protein
MKIDVNGTNEKFAKAVNDAVKSAKTQAQSRAIRASNELRNSALRVLRGQRSGRVYKLPFSKKTYRASAPGEPPAVRSGRLRISWAARAIGKSDGEIIASIHTDVKYAPILQDGTKDGRIAARPFEEPIIDGAKDKVMAIFNEPYLNK